MSGRGEAFPRILIDKALEASGWNLLDPKQVRFEQHGASGRSDYLLLGRSGVLAVLEAKREDEDPYDAKVQAAGYAGNVRAPFVMLSNGRVHYFWNYVRKDDRDAYRIERLPSLVDLERLRLRNLQPPRTLLSDPVGQDYLARVRPGVSLRGYQVRALDTIARGFDGEARRRFLLEMATGTGKTLLCAALIRRFLVTRNAERVLFIVDRIELANQTREEFGAILGEYRPVIFKEARHKPQDMLGSSVVIATIQSLMADRRYRTEFTPFHFDLVVNDEAHRSIYGDARECVQFFQATRVGLTATPKAYLKNVDLESLAAEDPRALEARQLRDTYHYFGCEPGEPTFRYDLIDAAKDPEGPFLCLPVIHDIRSDITTKALADEGWSVTIDEREETYKVRDLERKVFTPARNRVMCEALLKHGQRDPSGKLGRTIVFAVNQAHATAITKVLNTLQPGLALTITSRIDSASQLAKDFRGGKRPEPVAVSVDMLSTGYNCPDLLNIALMRPVFSPTEYVQIKGRGTRRFTFRVGNTEYEKSKFFILDFCGVAEFFEEKYDYTVPLAVPRENAVCSAGGSSRTGEPSLVAGSEAVLHGDRPVPVWTGMDNVASEEVRIVGPDGEKVDAMTFRGAFKRDLADFAGKNRVFRDAVDEEDDDAVETILQGSFFHRPEMFYSPGKLVQAHGGLPAPTSAFVYDALGKRPLPLRDELVRDSVESIAARFNLRFRDQRLLQATADLITSELEARRQFLAEDPGMFDRAQFKQLGGFRALQEFEHRNDAFEALRRSPIVRQVILAETP